MKPDEKILEILRNALVNNASIQGYVSDRVYAQHISSVDNPVYPAISFFLLTESPVARTLPLFKMIIQIDLWFPSSRPVDEMMACKGIVYDILNGNALLDPSLKSITEVVTGPVLFEQESQIFHLPVQYEIWGII